MTNAQAHYCAVVGVLAVIGWWSAVHACHSKIEGRGEAAHVLGPSILTPGIHRHDRARRLPSFERTGAPSLACAAVLVLVAVVAVLLS